MEREYFVYRHIRLDTNEVFYVGYGLKPLNYNYYSGEYKRAFSKNSRNKYWHNIVYISEYKIEILFESNFLEKTLEKEAEFILLYGRKHFEGGSLCNRSTGGDWGATGYKHSEETKRKMSITRTGKTIASKGRKLDPERVKICSEAHKYGYKHNSILLITDKERKNYESIQKASEDTGISYLSIFNNITGRSKSTKAGIFKSI